MSVASELQEWLDALRARHELSWAATGAFATKAHPFFPPERKFASSRQSALRKQYKALSQIAWRRSGVPVPGAVQRTGEQQIDTFIRALEHTASRLAHHRKPAKQDDRRDDVIKLANAIERLRDAVVGLDAGALAHVVSEIVSDVDPEQAYILAGALREVAISEAPPLAAAIASAAKTLPKIGHKESHPNLEAAVRIRRIFAEHWLPFEPRATGFAAECFRCVQELAGHEALQRPENWLEKAARETPPDFSGPFFTVFALRPHTRVPLQEWGTRMAVEGTIEHESDTVRMLAEKLDYITDRQLQELADVKDTTTEAWRKRGQQLELRREINTAVRACFV